MTTTEAHTAYLGRTPYGERIFIHLAIETLNRATKTTEHNHSATCTRISVTGSLVRRGARSVSASGQIVEDVRNLLRAAATLDGGWKRSDVNSLLKIWREWHLNDLQAGCAHMDLPEDESYDARQHITCPVTGYRYGTAWLYREPSADVLDEMARLMALPTGKVPAYVR